MNSNGYGTEVILLGSTKTEHLLVGRPAEDVIEWAGRLCYDTQRKTGQAPGWIQARIKDGHESLIEHASATFYIRCSRVVTHELVRHRIASYSQRSQRYVKESSPAYIHPPELGTQEAERPAEGWPDNALSVMNYAMEQAWRAYNILLKAGIRPEIARYVLPNACETQIVMTMNFRELRHFIKLRTSPRALPEMREVAGKVKTICQENWPRVFGDL